jgi:hypothetical protein
MIPNIRLSVKEITLILLKLVFIKFAEPHLCKQYVTLEIHND